MQEFLYFLLAIWERHYQDWRYFETVFLGAQKLIFRMNLTFYFSKLMTSRGEIENVKKVLTSIFCAKK